VEAANQIFLSQTITPQPQYESVLKKHYMAEIEKVDFSSPDAAVQVINRWVNMLTHGQIPSLVEAGTYNILLPTAYYVLTHPFLG
jgi:serine protease inhibitor